MTKYGIVLGAAIISGISFASEYTCNFVHGWPPSSLTSVTKIFRTGDPPLHVTVYGILFAVKTVLVGSDQTLQLRITDGHNVTGTVVKDGYDHPYLTGLGAQVQCWRK